MNLATLALTGILALGDTTAIKSEIYSSAPLRPNITQTDSVRSGPVLPQPLYRQPEEHHEYHPDFHALPHERHLPLSLHRSRLHGAERNFPYEHIAAGLHAGTKHLDFEIDFVIETEPHEHHNYATIRTVPGIGFAVSYHR